MLVAIDLDGTILAAPQEFATFMASLINSGNRVVILTGVNDGVSPDQAGWNAKAAKLQEAVGGCWHELVLFGCVDQALADAKAQWCVQNGADVLIDNTKLNAKAAVAAGVPLVLVPWASRT